MNEEMQLKKMRLEILGDIEDTSKDEIFKLKLTDAKYIALNTLYPFNDEITTLPERYKNWQVRCAIELYNRIGEENIESYSENGISYSYGDNLVSKELMSELTPKAGVSLWK